MTLPDGASVIVRAKDKIGTIERTLRAVRAQTVAAELVVVDSGSTDGTLEIARRFADRLVEIPPAEFSYGGALNVGARVATGEVHLALSAHSVPLSDTWIEDSLRHYRRDDVAGTGFGRRSPWGDPIEDGGFHQTFADAVAHPLWGFSNHGSSWRADAWRQVQFRDDLPASEDKEWSWCVLARGWTIAYAPDLGVTDGHRRAAGVAAYGRRIRRERAAHMALGTMARPTLGRSVQEWWHPEHRPGYRPLVLRRLSPYRLAEIGATYWAGRTAGQLPSRLPVLPPSRLPVALTGPAGGAR